MVFSRVRGITKVCGNVVYVCDGIQISYFRNLDHELCLRFTSVYDYISSLSLGVKGVCLVYVHSPSNSRAYYYGMGNYQYSGSTNSSSRGLNVRGLFLAFCSGLFRSSVTKMPLGLLVYGDRCLTPPPV